MVKKFAFLIGGTHSGCGKTTISLALMAAFKARGLRVQAFKVGPDFIDPGFHTQITGLDSRNLDGWMLGRDYNQGLFGRLLAGADMAIVEGVMGLYDGYDGITESGSSAEMAKWLGLPVVLVVDARSMARSAAALVYGFRHFDPGLRFAGVIFNQIGGPGHLGYLREAMSASLPEVLVLGGIPREDPIRIPERHLGLVTSDEITIDPLWEQNLAGLVERYVDLDLMVQMVEYGRDDGVGNLGGADNWIPAFAGMTSEGSMAMTSEGLSENPPKSPFRKGGLSERNEFDHAGACRLNPKSPFRKGGLSEPSFHKGGAVRILPPSAVGELASQAAPDGSLGMRSEDFAPVTPTGAAISLEQSVRASAESPVTIAVARDAAFCFYYPDNFELLRQAGAEIVFFSPLAGEVFPVNSAGLYLGGGYPELYAENLASRKHFLAAIRDALSRGMPVYAECGGLMTLSRFIDTLDGKRHAMAGVLPFGTRMLQRRKALGYTEVVLKESCLLGERDWVIRGHEFHYSEMVEEEADPALSFAYRIRGRKFETDRPEGYRVGSALASYVHLHWGSAPRAPASFVRRCREYLARVN